MDLADLLAVVGTGPRGTRDLNFVEAREAMLAILDRRWHPVTLGAFLMAMRWKGETAEEMAGFAAAVRETLAWPAGGAAQAAAGGAEAGPAGGAAGGSTAAGAEPGAAGFLDWAGNYDGHARTLHLGVAAGIVAAAAGQPVVLHGAEGVPTKEGVTPVAVARALGIALPAAAEEALALLARHGFAVLEQAAFHPRLHFLLPERRALGKRSFINTVEPLANPLGAASHLGSFAHAPFGERLCRAAARGAGFRRVVAVMGLEGMAFPRPGRMLVVEWPGGEAGAVRQFHVDARELGLVFAEEDLRAQGDLAARVARSAEMTERVLRLGEPAAARDAVLAGAALAIYAGGRGGPLAEAVTAARRALAEGAAAAALDRLASGPGFGAGRREAGGPAPTAPAPPTR